ncbi:cytochrome P450 [Pyruvatibacter sp. HU-CL02332]|uniref:cytochrome P450 n=1 Tax=Pyruvatibacter sp. HU-CL02332 TaxID=3127650 RepID=UPI003101F6E8
MEATLDSNIIDPDIFLDEQGPPHRIFDLWREQDPVHWNAANPNYISGMPGSTLEKGFWVLTRYEDVSTVSMDQETFSSYENGIVVWDPGPQELERQRSNFMGMRPADHTAVRRVLMPPFMPKALNNLAPRVDKLAEEIIDSVASRGECEFVFDVASKLPVFTFCELMGIPEHYREKVAEYGNELADVETRSELSLDPTIGLFAISEELSAEKRANPDGSLISEMVNDKTLNLSQMAINQFVLVFAMAGHETTRSTAAHFINLMNQHPDQYELLLGDVDKHLDNAIDEVLRYTSTTTNFCRTATVDVEVSGQRIRKGDKIYMSYAAANRDPSVFEDPHRFDITRANARRHIAFGTGPHICIGARLARMQLRSLIKQIVSRVPDIRVSGDPVWMRSIWFNAILSLPVVFTPEGQ